MSFSPEQINVGQQVIQEVKSLGLSASDTALAELDAITAGLAESGLRNIDYGDYPASMGGQMSSSRGVFQQIAAWGPESARENVAEATRMFLEGGQAGQSGLLDINGWDQMEPWTAVQAVQQSEFADGSNYRAQLSTAQQFIRQYGAGAGSVPSAVNVSDPGGSGGTSAGNLAGQMLGLAFPPFAGLSGVSDAAGGILTGVGTILVEGVFLMTGLVLVLFGVWRMSAPARQRAESIAATAAVA
jgi:hypothetical protein